MKYRYLGQSGLIVSRIALGAMTFGQDKWGCDEKESVALVHKFLDAGGNFIDTADIYAAGRSEEIVGKALAGGRRRDVVLATKCCQPTGSAPTARGLSAKHIAAACEASLKRLQTDCIDLYQIHGPDPRTPWEVTMRALDDLVRQGKVRALGCCNLYGWQIVKANAASRALSAAPFASGQYLYNLINRDVEREVLGACRAEDMGFMVWSPLAGGMLTGKYARREKPEQGTRIALRANLEVPRYWHDRGFAVAERVSALAKKTGLPEAQLALGWLLFHPGVTAVIAGTRSAAQLTQNLVSADWDIPQDLWNELTLPDDFEPGYPENWIRQANERNFTVAERF